MFEYFLKIHLITALPTFIMSRLVYHIIKVPDFFKSCVTAAATAAPVFFLNAMK